MCRCADVFTGGAGRRAAGAGCERGTTRAEMFTGAGTGPPPVAGRRAACTWRAIRVWHRGYSTSAANYIRGSDQVVMW